MDSSDRATRGSGKEPEITARETPPAFAVEDMEWYADATGRPLAGFLELVRASKAAFLGIHGLFVHWNVPGSSGMFPWYDNSDVGWDNRSRDLEGLRLDSHQPAPLGADRQIRSADDLVGFCRFVIVRLSQPIIDFDSAVANDPGFWLSSSNGKRCSLCLPYDAGALIADVYRICTCILPAEKVPPRPEATTFGGLNSFLDKVHLECLKLSNPDGKPGYLDLHVDYDRRTVWRDGHRHIIEFANKLALWEIFCVLWEAGERGTSVDELRARTTSDWDSRRVHRHRLNIELHAIGIEVVDKGLRLADDGTTGVKKI
jgi:hypothetical protein